MASDPSSPPGTTTGPSQPAEQTATTASPGGAGAAPASRPARPWRRGSAPGRLDLGDAIHDGWQAFCRAPKVFVAFALLVNGLLLLVQPLVSRIGSVSHPSRQPLDWALYSLGLALALVLNLWGRLGLARGSLLALQGRRPSLPQLLRWDGRAMGRLLRAWLRLAALVGLPLAAATLLVGLPLLLLAEPVVQQGLGLDGTRLLALLLAALLLLCVALTLVALLYLSVNQVFLVQIVLLERCGGGKAVQRGRDLVDPQWPLVLLLVIVTGLLNGLGLLACMVGSLVAWPAVICITTAAYQQLRQSAQRRRVAVTAEGSGQAGDIVPTRSARF